MFDLTLPARTPLAATLLCAVSFAAIVCMLHDGLDRAAAIQRWQVDYRFLFSAFVSVASLTARCNGSLQTAPPASSR